MRSPQSSWQSSCWRDLAIKGPTWWEHRCEPGPRGPRRNHPLPCVTGDSLPHHSPVGPHKVGLVAQLTLLIYVQARLPYFPAQLQAAGLQSFGVWLQGPQCGGLHFHCQESGYQAISYLI